MEKHSSELIRSLFPHPQRHDAGGSLWVGSGRSSRSPAPCWARQAGDARRAHRGPGRRQTRQVLDLILTLKERGLAVVVISHNLGDVFEVADRVAVLYSVVTPGTSSSRTRPARRSSAPSPAARRRGRRRRKRGHIMSTTARAIRASRSMPRVSRLWSRFTGGSGGRARLPSGHRRPDHHLAVLLLQGGELPHLRQHHQPDAAGDRFGIIATGIVLVLLLGEIDLSVGIVSGLAASVMAVLNVQLDGRDGRRSWPACRRPRLRPGPGLLITYSACPLRGHAGRLLAFQGALLWVLGSTGTVNITDTTITDLANTSSARRSVIIALVVLVPYVLLTLFGYRRRSRRADIVPFVLILIRLVVVVAASSSASRCSTRPRCAPRDADLRRRGDRVDSHPSPAFGRPVRGGWQRRGGASRGLSLFRSAGHLRCAPPSRRSGAHARRPPVRGHQSAGERLLSLVGVVAWWLSAGVWCCEGVGGGVVGGGGVGGGGGQRDGERPGPPRRCAGRGR